MKFLCRSVDDGDDIDDAVEIEAFDAEQAAEMLAERRDDGYAEGPSDKQEVAVKVDGEWQVFAVCAEASVNYTAHEKE